LVVKLELIENSGPDNLRKLLKAKLAHAAEVSIAVAFTTEAGLDEIIQPLRQVATKGSVRLLTGLYQKVTEPGALRKLLQVQKQTNGRFAVRLSKEPQFHRKFYVVRTSKQHHCFIGSSNLTAAGMKSGGELNALITLPKNSLPAKKNLQSFNDQWEHRALPLTIDQILAYEKARPEPPLRTNLLKSEFKKILGTAPTHDEAPKEIVEVKFWRDYVLGQVKKRTTRIISETTNWDEKDYWWFCAAVVQPYTIGDR
jgi:HKD family nuclease